MESNECWLAYHDECGFYAPPLLNCECLCHLLPLSDEEFSQPLPSSWG